MAESKPRNKKPKIRPQILSSVYETALDLYEIGLMDAVTWRQFEYLGKKQVRTLSPSAIKKLRLREKVSQPVFAWYLNVKPTTVKKWETGDNKPSGPALRLLNLIEAKGLESVQP